ncbi:MAG: hypothetical protein DWQ05_22335 [Calditrichaeota bacterium]|nr:MAG: hypothetical protein DWQ05_22335 [Calditrichota bacterium]
MNIYIYLSVAYIIFVVTTLLIDLLKKTNLEPVNSINMSSMNEFVMDEWKTTVSVKMHFNDMIIKFRTMIFSIFLALSGIILAYIKYIGFHKIQKLLFLINIQSY